MGCAAGEASVVRAMIEHEQDGREPGIPACQRQMNHRDFVFALLHQREDTMPGLLPDVDPDGLLEYSVVYTDRALNHMSRHLPGGDERHLGRS